MTGNSQSNLRAIVILGGGSAGWMTAAALSSLLDPKSVSVTLVESDQIGTVGVGEATIPDIVNFNRILGIPEQEFMQATNATFKLGIQFDNWGKVGDSYFHPFGRHGADMQGIDFHQFWLHARKNGLADRFQDFSICSVAADKHKFNLPGSNPRDVSSEIRYAYHFDAILYARFLRRYAEERGVKRVEGKVENVLKNSESGHIQNLILQSGENVAGDFFFDCTGFRSLLMSKTLHVRFKDWSHWLPCDSALAVACEQNGPLLPYTKANAKSAGWQWRIPTQQRTGNGHIYAREFIDDETAASSLLADLDGAQIGSPKQLRFKTGCLEKFWEGNCIAIGLSAGFLEPLESTSIYLIQEGISKFIALFPDASISPVVQAEYNKQLTMAFEQVRDFLVLHYSATERNDSPFWDYCRNMSLPDSLIEKMGLLNAAGRFFRYEEELFTKDSWIAVAFGQNLYPKSIDPIVCALPAEKVINSLNSMRSSIDRVTDNMPTHSEFIDNYCAA